MQGGYESLPERRIAIIKKTRLPKLSLSSLERLIFHSLDANKADDIVSIDVHAKSDFADRMIVASGTSARHVGALAEHVVKALKDVGYPSVPVEGKENCDWVLVDAGDVVVHIFRPEARSYYNLEKMWSVALPQQQVELAY